MAEQMLVRRTKNLKSPEVHLQDFFHLKVQQPVSGSLYELGRRQGEYEDVEI